MNYTIKAIAIAIFIVFSTPSFGATAPDINTLISENTGDSLLKAGLMYENGDGVKRNIVEAAKLYLSAGNKGNFHAHYALWDMWDLFSERGAPQPPFNDPYQFVKSQKEALVGYKKLLIKHPSDAEIHYRLARLYSPGIGVYGKEYQLEMKHLKIAAKLGHQEAKELLITIRDINSYIK